MTLLSFDIVSSVKNQPILERVGWSLADPGVGSPLVLRGLTQSQKAKLLKDLEGWPLYKSTIWARWGLGALRGSEVPLSPPPPPSVAAPCNLYLWRLLYSLFQEFRNGGF